MKNLPLKVWCYGATSNFRLKIFSNFEAFSEHPNFIWNLSFDHGHTGCPCSYIPVIWISILTCKPNNLRNSNCGTAEYICISSRISLKMWTFVTTCGNALYFLTIDRITEYILKQLKALSFSYVVVHLIPCWLVLGRNQAYCA